MRKTEAMATPNPDEQNPLAPRPRLEPTRLATLIVAALITAALAWLMVSRFYGDMPTLPWLPPLTMTGLAIVEGITAWTTKERIDRKPGTIPVDPLVVARYVVLAKASALAGALLGGLYLGLTTGLLAMRGNTHADADLPRAAVGLAGSLALVAAGLWLERACRVPTPPPGSDPAGGDSDRRESRADDDRSAG
jgi:hypothetical protein